MNLETLNYKNLEWYIIKETEKEKLLFLKDILAKEYIQKYFTDESMVDKYFDVRFNKDKTCPWWESSYIREVLNGPFLNDLLDINDLNLMKTTVKLKEKERTTKDYVRLITKEEVKNLPTEILKTLRDWGYFTMSPSSLIGSNGSACVLDAGDFSDPKYLNYNYVSNARGVRPVVSLKSNNLKTEMDESDIELIEEMKRVIKL